MRQASTTPLMGCRQRCADMAFPAFLDTNVLYGAVLSDTLLRLAERGTYRPAHFDVRRDDAVGVLE